MLFLCAGWAFPAFGNDSVAAEGPAVIVGNFEDPPLRRDASLSPAFLLEPKSVKEVGNPYLIVGHYSLSQGLLAAYQAETGKRILFTAKFRLGGSMSSQILHLDPYTGKIVPIIERSRQRNAFGQPVEDVEIAGVDLRAFMKGGGRNRDGKSEKEQQLKQFLKGDTGQALLDGVAALYAALEDVAPEPGSARLLAPFGAITMVLQLGGREYRGLKNADKIFGTAKSQRMREACIGVDDCLMRGNSFMVHRSGLFDVLSKPKAAPVGKHEPSGQTPAQPAGLERLMRPGTLLLEQQLTLPGQASGNQVWQKSGDGACSLDHMNNPAVCFGQCGPGCAAPGGVETAQCLGHDYCVCAYGHAACLSGTPLNCGLADPNRLPCYSLWDAAHSYFESVWSDFWNWLGDLLQGFWEWLNRCVPPAICPT